MVVVNRWASGRVWQLISECAVRQVVLHQNKTKEVVADAQESKFIGEKLEELAIEHSGHTHLQWAGKLLEQAYGQPGEDGTRALRGSRDEHAKRTIRNSRPSAGEGPASAQGPTALMAPAHGRLNM